MAYSMTLIQWQQTNSCLIKDVSWMNVLSIQNSLTGSSSVHDGECVDSDGWRIEEGQSTETIGNRVFL